MMKNFDDFLNQCDYRQMARSVQHFVDDSMSQVKNPNDIEEVLELFARGNSAATASFFIQILRSYHDWLQSQLESR